MRCFAILACLLFSGCSMLPEVAHQPTLHNPFPQLTKIAIAPFFNQSHEPTLDGRRVAAAYYSELQRVPGFEVLAVGVVERAMERHQIMLRSPADARRLAQLLEVDVLVVGSVTDYSPYYPPRMAMHVEWYTANPCFHAIPPGYGLPFGTPCAKDIPDSLVFEAHMAAARAQLARETPSVAMAAPDAAPAQTPGVPSGGATGANSAAGATILQAATDPDGPVVSHQTRPPEHAPPGLRSPPVAGLPADWKEKQAQNCPDSASASCLPTSKPVMQHTRTYVGNDAQVIEALRTYYYFADDARLGGWEGYLQRSDDFIRFCCHMNIWEMLSARGGAGPARVVWRWPRKSD